MRFKSLTNDQTVPRYRYFNFYRPHKVDGKGFFSQMPTLKTVPSDQKSNRRTCAEECQIPFKARLNGFNICPTFIQQKLSGCWANVGQNVEWSVQMASTPFNILRSRGDIASMLNGSFNQFKLIQHTFKAGSKTQVTFHRSEVQVTVLKC